MNKDFGLILNLAAAVGAEMPATRAAFEVNEAQSAQGQEQDFSAVILEMEKKAHLGFRGQCADSRWHRFSGKVGLFD
jgi:hypothetical protein